MLFKRSINNSRAKYGKILDICKRFPKKHKTWGLGTHPWDKQNRLALGLTNRLYYFVFVNLEKMPYDLSSKGSTETIEIIFAEIRTLISSNKKTMQPFLNTILVNYNLESSHNSLVFH